MIGNIIKGIYFAAANKRENNFLIDPFRSLITYYMSPILPAIYRLYFSETSSNVSPLPVSEDFYGPGGVENDLECFQESPKDGTVFLMLHGFCDTAHTYTSLGKHFYDLGYSVSCPRIEGHGLMSYTDIPVENLKTKMIESVYQKYCELIERPEIKKVNIVGYSMGSALALALVRKINLRKQADLVNKMFLISPAVYHTPDAQTMLDYFGELYQKYPLLPFPRLYGDPIDPYFSDQNFGYACINGAITLALNNLMIDARILLKRMRNDIHMIVGDKDKALDGTRWGDVFDSIGSEVKTLDIIEGGYHGLISQAAVENADGTKTLKAALIIEDYLAKDA